MGLGTRPEKDFRIGRNHSSPIIGFYGDDFTGSTDALAQFTRFGLRGILLLRAVTSDGLDPPLEGFDVVGVAGVSRALPTDDMETEVRPALAALAGLDPMVVQYKVCSTFDSSPAVGSIGRMLDLGIEMFGAAPVPVLAAQPGFGRYTVFGNHFADHRGTVYRLDQHPIMSAHPSTPMNEGDLRRILAEQTRLDVGLLSILDLDSLTGGTAPLSATSVLSVNAGASAVVVDALTNDDLVRAASHILATSTGHTPRFVVGSGGLSYGLARNLGARQERVLAPPPAMSQVIAVSGSCSSQTRRQIDYAVAHGWFPVPVDPTHFSKPTERRGAMEEATQQVMNALGRGLSVAVHSTTGQEKPEQVTRGSDIPPLELVRHIGDFYGDLLSWVLTETDVNRAIIAGGDTSGFTVRRLNAYGLEVEGILAEAASLCRLISDNPGIDGVQVVLKGGQVGADDFFELVRGS